VPSKIASDLSGFRAITFMQNQTCNESIQRVTLSRSCMQSDGDTEIEKQTIGYHRPIAVDQYCEGEQCLQ